MPKMTLECPECEARYTLRRYSLGKRVRCRKCRAVMMIPPVGELLTPEERARVAAAPDDFEVHRTVARILSLPKLAVLALLVAVAVGAAAFVLYRKSRAPRVVVTAPPKPALDPSKLAAANRFLEFPIGLKWEWVFGDAAGAEERWYVNFQTLSPEGGLLFEVVVTGAGGSHERRIQMTTEGAFLAGETRGGEKYRFEPPLPFVKFPLYEGDAWSYHGRRVREAGGSELWDLDFKVGVETVEIPDVKKAAASTVACTGTRGAAKVEETVWYVKGVGAVKRRTSIDGSIEARTLLRHSEGK